MVTSCKHWLVEWLRLDLCWQQASSLAWACWLEMRLEMAWMLQFWSSQEQWSSCADRIHAACGPCKIVSCPCFILTLRHCHAISMSCHIMPITGDVAIITFTVGPSWALIFEVLKSIWWLSHNTIFVPLVVVIPLVRLSMCWCHTLCTLVPAFGRLSILWCHTLCTLVPAFGRLSIWWCHTLCTLVPAFGRLSMVIPLLTVDSGVQVIWRSVISLVRSNPGSSVQTYLYGIWRGPPTYWCHIAGGYACTLEPGFGWTSDMTLRHMVCTWEFPQVHASTFLPWWLEHMRFPQVHASTFCHHDWNTWDFHKLMSFLQWLEHMRFPQVHALTFLPRMRFPLVHALTCSCHDVSFGLENMFQDFLSCVQLSDWIKLYSCP